MAIGIVECRRTDARNGRSADSVASCHRPRQPGVMRPMASTWVASRQNIAAPDSARLLMCEKCQSFALPPSAEYWHIGATMIRLGNARSRRRMGENRALIKRYPIPGKDRLHRSIIHSDDGRRMSNTWNGLPETQRSQTRTFKTLRVNPGGLDQLEILGDLARHERIHLLRRHRKGFDTEPRQAFLHRRLRQHPGSRIV